MGGKISHQQLSFLGCNGSYIHEDILDLISKILGQISWIISEGLFSEEEEFEPQLAVLRIIFSGRELKEGLSHSSPTQGLPSSLLC